jgi:glycosyltransferase involved in cell wall biosynthesis
VYARRRKAPKLPPGVTLYDHYQVPPGARPALRETRCVDWIDSVPIALQYIPARVQELTFSRNAAAALEREGADVIAYSREIECALRLLRRGRRRVFLELHRIPGGELRRKWLREVLPLCSGVIAISDGFDAARFASLPARAAAREQLGLPLEQPIAVYTGGLLAWKGADLIVEAARLVPQVQFVIAGGQAADVAKLRESAGALANLRIDGFQPPERVALYLAAADLGLAPNRSQPAISSKYTSPLKVFEAMAAGLPLVASDLPSLRDILTHDRDGWLVAPDDARALAEGVQRLVADPDLRRRLGSTLAQRSADHTWDARAARLVAWMSARG